MKIGCYLVLTVLISACGGESSSPENVVVVKSSETIQCEGGGFTLQEIGTPLSEAGINVLQSRCGYLKGVANADVCGAPTLDVYLFTIPRSSLDTAEAMGYMLGSDEDDPGDDEIAYGVSECGDV